MYVDDVLDSPNDEEKALTKEVDEVLKAGGFSIKKWSISGQEADDSDRLFEVKNMMSEDMRMEEESVTSMLGMRWRTSEDILCFKIKLNFSPKRNKRRTGPDLELGELNNKFPTILSRRDVIAQVNGFFDPLGLASPVTVAAKIMVRKLWIGEMKGYGWDDPIPGKLYEEWKIFFQMLYKIELLRFPRSLKPAKVGDENPILIIFSDASEQVYGSCGYARWKMTDGSFKNQLIIAKNKNRN